MLSPVGMERPEVEVEAEILADDQKIELKKVMLEKWVTRRGLTRKLFQDTKPRHISTGLEKKAGEYKAYIDTLVHRGHFQAA